MTKIRRIIDFEIIWKKNNASISECEEKALEKWMIEDRKHIGFIENAKRYYAEGSSYKKTAADSTKALKEVYTQIYASQRKRNVRRLAYISSIAASIILIVSLYVLSPRKDKIPANSEIVQPIESGRNKARLILDDGSAFDLLADKEISIQEGGAQISSQGTAIHYVQDKNPIPKIKYNTLEVPRGGEFMLSLSDGTKVWLNSETTLRYPVRFSGKERKVELIGEAYFEVSRNEKKPFLVISGEQVVEVLGTSFNIASYAEDSMVSTTLVEGKVSVFLKEHPEERQILMPNFQCNLNINENTISQRKVDIEQFTAWKEGQFYFKGQTLVEIMRILSRWYDVDISFENEEAKNIKFTGNLKRYENFERIPALFEKTEEVEFKIEGRSISII